MPLSTSALRFVANNTDNRYELGICVDQLGECHGVTPKVALPIDWVREALRSGVAKSAFAARYCDDEAVLGTLVSRERRARVQQALASNPCLSNASFRELLANVGGADRNRAHTVRELEKLRKAAVRKRAADARRRERPGVVAGPTSETLLANPRTYTTKTVSSVLLVLRAHDGEAYVVDNLLRREAEAGATRFALAYLKSYYIAASAHADVWERCALSPAEVVSLHVRAKRVTLLMDFMRALYPIANPQRALGPDITALIKANLPAHRIAGRSTYRASGKFSPEAIDVLLADQDWHWVGLLWDHTLSEQQFVAVIDSVGNVHKDLLLNLMGDDPKKLAMVLVAAYKNSDGLGRLFYKGEVVSLERKLAKVPTTLLHELIDTTPSLAYMLMNNALFSEYIYQRLTASGLSMLAVVEALEDNKDLSLGKFLDDIASPVAIA